MVKIGKNCQRSFWMTPYGEYMHPNDHYLGHHDHDIIWHQRMNSPILQLPINTNQMFLSLELHNANGAGSFYQLTFQFSTTLCDFYKNKY